MHSSHSSSALRSLDPLSQGVAGIYGRAESRVQTESSPLSSYLATHGQVEVAVGDEPWEAPHPFEATDVVLDREAGIVLLELLPALPVWKGGHAFVQQTAPAAAERVPISRVSDRQEPTSFSIPELLSTRQKVEPEAGSMMRVSSRLVVTWAVPQAKSRTSITSDPLTALRSSVTRETMTVKPCVSKRAGFRECVVRGQKRDGILINVL